MEVLIEIIEIGAEIINAFSHLEKEKKEVKALEKNENETLLSNSDNKNILKEKLD